jgi:ArsR family transcriptional regulator
LSALLPDGSGGPAIALQLGDFNALPIGDDSADHMVMHQVLHFAQDPEHALREAERVLRPGGRLIIVDFAPHDREELREVHAHARLGFDDSSMARWFAEARLSEQDSITLDGGPLTVRIWVAQKTADILSLTPPPLPQETPCP